MAARFSENGCAGEVLVRCGVSELDKVEGETELRGERSDRACEVGRLEGVDERVDESFRSRTR